MSEFFVSSHCPLCHVITFLFIVATDAFISALP